MIPYTDFTFFGLLLYAVVPTLILGLFGRAGWRWALLVTAVMFVLQYHGPLNIRSDFAVREIWIVLAKFLASFVLFLLLWMPFWLYLVALRIGGRTPFDYSPVFSFMLVLAVTGAGFVAMGVFFSSLTHNQVASAVLTFAGMILYFGIHFAWIQVRRSNTACGSRPRGPTSSTSAASPPARARSRCPPTRNSAACCRSSRNSHGRHPR